MAKTDEIINFLNNKVIEGIYSDNSKFIEIFQVTVLLNLRCFQEQGVYRGQWKVENNYICFFYDASQYDCVNYYANDNNKIYILGTDQEIFSQITSVNDINSSNSLATPIKEST